MRLLGSYEATGWCAHRVQDNTPPSSVKALPCSDVCFFSFRRPAPLQPAKKLDADGVSRSLLKAFAYRSGSVQFQAFGPKADYSAKRNRVMQPDAHSGFGNIHDFTIQALFSPILSPRQAHLSGRLDSILGPLLAATHFVVQLPRPYSPFSTAGFCFNAQSSSG